MTTVLVVDESKLRDRDRAPARALIAAMNRDAECGRHASVALSTQGDRVVVAGQAYDVANVFGPLEELEGPIAPDVLVSLVARRLQLAGELTRRMRARSSFALRHWPTPFVGNVILVLCTPYGVVVADARRQLAEATP